MNDYLIIIDARLPKAIKENLKEYGELFEIPALTGYEAISGHPDIYICQSDEMIIISPDLPVQMVKELKEKIAAEIVIGTSHIGTRYPETARYNAVVTKEYLICNQRIVEPTILSRFKNRKPIHINQGYTRCNLLPLSNGGFLTGDSQIKRHLEAENLKTFYIEDQSAILLSGFRHGFIGGTAGIAKNHLFFTGDITILRGGDILYQSLEKAGFEIHTLSDSLPIDAGSILFIEKRY